MALREALRPWYEPLGKLGISCEGDGVVWLHVESTLVRAEAAATAVEAIQLLAQLAWVSWQDFAAVVDDVWPAKVELGTPLRVGIRVQTGHTNGPNGLVALRACLSGITGETPTPLLSPSAAYNGARRVLKQAPHSDDTLVPEIPITILFHAWHPRHFNKALALIVDATRSQDTLLKSSNAAIENDRLHLRIIKVYLPSKSSPVAKDVRIQLLDELVTRGVKLGSCTLPSLGEGAKTSAQNHFFTVQKLLQTHELTATDAKGSAGIDELFLGASAMGPRMFSVVAATRAVRKVSLTFNDSYPYDVHLLALALFSDFAHHTVEEASIVFLNHDDFFTFLQIMIGNTEDPLITVLGGHAESIRANQHLRATASRFALYDPATEADDSNVVVETYQHTGLRVIDHDEEWWSVLLPAWGQAWVHRSDIVVTARSPEGTQRVVKRSLRCISIASGVDVAVASDFESLIPALNSEVEELELLIMNPAGPLDAWPRVFSSLDSLRSLNLGMVRYDQLESIVSTIATPHILPVLERLQLTATVKWDHGPFPARFIEALGSPNHRLYHCLEALELNTAGDRSTREVQDLASALDDALCKNKRLERLVFRVSGRRALSILAEVKHKLMHHDGKGISICQSRLAMRNRLAFISVVQGSRDDSGSDVPALHRLDTATMSMIMDLAATCRRRTVSLQTSCGVPFAG